MSDLFVSLLMLLVFVAGWLGLFLTGGLDWIADSRMASARRMLANSKYAFDGEVHVVPVARENAAKPAVKNSSQPQRGWIPQALSHA